MSKQGFARILPSGRAVRFVRPGVADYKTVRDKMPLGYRLGDLAGALLPYVLTGMSSAPVPVVEGEARKDDAGRVLGKDGRTLPLDDNEQVIGEPDRYIDEAAMIRSVDGGGAGGWIDLNYLKLVAKPKDGGLSLFDQLFADYLADYLAMEGEVMALIIGGEGAVKRPPGAPPTRV